MHPWRRLRRPGQDPAGPAEGRPGWGRCCPSRAGLSRPSRAGLSCAGPGRWPVAAVAVSAAGRPSRSRSAPSPGWAGASVYGSRLRSADAQTRAATRAAAAGSAPPASRWMCHMPLDRPSRSSVCRCRSRRAATSRSGNRSASPIASRSCRAASSASHSRLRGGTGWATTSQPNGPAQAGSRHSSSDGAACSRSGGASGVSSSPSLIPPIARQQASPDMAEASAPRPRACPRAPPGRASITSAPPLLPASDVPAARSRTGPPACRRIQPNATAPPAW